MPRFKVSRLITSYSTECVRIEAASADEARDLAEKDWLLGPGSTLEWEEEVSGDFEQQWETEPAPDEDHDASEGGLT